VDQGERRRHRSIQRKGFATLNLEKLHALIGRYRAWMPKMRWWRCTRCALSQQHCCGSIDTPLHAFLPFKHIDHLHPDWASLWPRREWPRENEEFNRTYGHKLIWLPWQRPGFELAMMLREAVKQTPDCDVSFWAPRSFYVGDTSISATRTPSRSSTSSGNSYPSTSKDGEQICLAGTVPPLLKIIFLSRRDLSFVRGACLPSSA